MISNNFPKLDRQHVLNIIKIMEEKDPAKKKWSRRGLRFYLQIMKEIGQEDPFPVTPHLLKGYWMGLIARGRRSLLYYTKCLLAYCPGNSISFKIHVTPYLNCLEKLAVVQPREQAYPILPQDLICAFHDVPVADLHGRRMVLRLLLVCFLCLRRSEAQLLTSSFEGITENDDLGLFMSKSGSEERPIIKVGSFGNSQEGRRFLEYDPLGCVCKDHHMKEFRSPHDPLCQEVISDQRFGHCPREMLQVVKLPKHLGDLEERGKLVESQGLRVGGATALAPVLHESGVLNHARWMSGQMITYYARKGTVVSVSKEFLVDFTGITSRGRPLSYSKVSDFCFELWPFPVHTPHFVYGFRVLSFAMMGLMSTTPQSLSGKQIEG